MSDDPLRVPTLPHHLPPPPPPSSAPLKPSLEALLGAPLTLTLVDGRTIIGYFACVDQQCNIVLRDAEEFRKPPAGLAASMERAEKRREARRAAGEGGGREGEEVGPDEEDAGQLLEDDGEDDEEVKVWKNREAYWPKSEPFAGYGSGWGGRSVGLVAAKEKDVVKIEVPDEVWGMMGGKKIDEEKRREEAEGQ
ncbi:hypothetical protein IAT38_002470 [Cryptococcus sp. DSM 104549]